MADPGPLQMRFTSTQGTYNLPPQKHTLLQSAALVLRNANERVGSFLRLSLRTVVHDAICSYFIDTRPYAPPSGLCGSQVQLG